LLSNVGFTAKDIQAYKETKMKFYFAPGACSLAIQRCATLIEARPTAQAALSAEGLMQH
jgi:hypothetical protein